MMLFDKWFLLRNGLRVYVQSPPRISPIDPIVATTHEILTSAAATVDLWVDNRSGHPARIYRRGFRLVVQRPGSIGRPLRLGFGMLTDSLPEYEEIPAKQKRHLMQITFISHTVQAPAMWAEFRKKGTKFRVYQVTALLKRGDFALQDYPQSFDRIGNRIPKMR